MTVVLKLKTILIYVRKVISNIFLGYKLGIRQFCTGDGRRGKTMNLLEEIETCMRGDFAQCKCILVNFQGGSMVCYSTYLLLKFRQRGYREGNMDYWFTKVRNSQGPKSN